MYKNKSRWKTMSMALFLALTGGALSTAHHSAHASHVSPEITDQTKTSASTMHQTKAFFNKLNAKYAQGADTYTQDQARQLEAKPAVNSTFSTKMIKAQEHSTAPVHHNKTADQYIANPSHNVKSNKSLATNMNSNTAKKPVSVVKKQTVQSKSNSQVANRVTNGTQKINQTKVQSQQNLKQHLSQATSHLTKGQKADAHKTAKELQAQWNRQNPILHSLNKEQLAVDKSFMHHHKDAIPSSILKFEQAQSRKDAKLYKQDTQSGGIYYQAPSSASASTGTAQSGSISYPASMSAMVDYSTDTDKKVPVYKTVNNTNYNFEQTGDDDENFYQTKFSESKPDNSIRYQDGNAKVNFGRPIYLNYKLHTKAGHHGDPQSVVLQGNKADVLFNVNHGDSKRNYNNVDRVLQYNINNGRLTKIGNKFTYAHGQGFAYNPASKQLWLINSRSALNTAPKLANINTRSLKPTGKTMDVVDPLPFGNDLAFDGQGNAYNVVRVFHENNPLHAPVGSLAMTEGRQEGNKMVFHVVQGFKSAPGYVVQNLAYNPYNNRMYVICNSSIISFPTNKVNHLSANDIRTTKFQHHFEMEDLIFTRKGSFLLMNWPARLLRSSNRF